MTCEACAAAAIDWASGEYRKGCNGCEVRAVSQAPDMGRRAFYAQITDGDERETFIAAVSVEYQRRKRLKAAA